MNEATDRQSAIAAKARSDYRAERVAAQSAAAANSRHTLLHLDTVSAMVGLSRTSIYDRIRIGTFPAPLRLSARCSRWQSEAVTNWLKAQQAAK